MILPEHMSVEDRNKRLYEMLKSMGLFVTPICRGDTQSAINSIVVACAMPTMELIACKRGSTPDVSVPVERPEIGEIVSSSFRAGGNVVKFPTEL